MTSFWLIASVGLAAGAATLLGGALVLRFRPLLDLLLGFASGTIIGVSLFDLMPEALDLASASHSRFGVMSAVGAGFALYLLFDGLAVASPQKRGGLQHLAPASLTVHSLLDGLGIGLAFHVSAGAAVILAVGVLSHDCVDGANTVALSLATGSGSRTARVWLALDAAAPLTGILIATQMRVTPSALAIMLGVFGGIFLYIGTSHVLSGGNQRRPPKSIALTIVGMAVIYGVSLLASG